MFVFAECKGVLRACVDAGAEEEPGAARIHQTAGEQDAPPRQGLHTCQTGIIPVSGSVHLISVHILIFVNILYERPLSICLVSLLKGSFGAMVRGPVSCPTSNPPGGPDLSPTHISGYNPSSSFFPASFNPEAGQQGKSQSRSIAPEAVGDSQQDVQDLKEQLEALRCQVGCSLQHSIKKCSHFSCDESRTDVNSLLPGKDLPNA